MAEEIRGLNVKFDADFSEFKKNMKSAEKDIGSTQRQLKTLQDSLKLEWDPKKFTQAQAQAQKALDATEEKASLLRNRLREIEAAGVTDKNRDEYNYLMEQIDKTDLSAQRLRQQMEELDEIRLKNVTAGIDEVTDKLDKASKKTKALSLAATGLVAGLTAVGLKTVENADEIATLATQYDMSIEAIQRFNYVALQTDTQAEALYKAFVKVQGGVADLQTGVESVSTKALQKLGLSFDQFEGNEEQFYAIVEALANMEDKALMVSTANDIFGEKMATNLLPLIYAGTEAINEYKTEFEDMGFLTEDQVQELAEFDNVLNELKTQYSNVALQLGSSLLPVMETFSAVLVEDILPILKDIVNWFANLDEGTQEFIVTLLLLTATLSPMLKLFSSVTGAVSTLIKFIKNMDATTLKAAGKWMIMGAAIASVFNLISNWSQLSTIEKILYTLATAALVAAAAIGAFHASWSIGLAVGAITAGIAAIMGAVSAAEEELGLGSGSSGYSVGTYDVPEYSVPETTTDYGSTTNNENTYVDNSNITISIEKNDYMSEDDIIKAVNKGLKQARQSRT